MNKMDDEPTEQERLMRGMLCEWSGKDDCRMGIEFRDGAREITMSIAPHGKDHTARGVRRSFNDAWDNLNPASV